MPKEEPVLLLLDDDQELAGLMGEIAEQAGFRTHVVHTAKSFDNALKLHDPDIVILDLQMPDTDGVEVLRRLADASIQSRILLVSGMDKRTIAAVEQFGRSRALHMLGSIQKPFAPPELLEKLLWARSITRPLSSADLERAVEEQQLLVYYQPTLRRFADGTWDIAAMEALLRWDHPERGVLTPDTFLKMGEDAGLIKTMTDHVLERSVEQLRAWQAQRLALGLRVNIAAQLITDVSFPDRLATLLEAHELDRSLLTLEITETAMLDQRPETLDILSRLRVKEINLAIDDFGIGYSSLTQLFRMPFNEMKIDKSLVLRMIEQKEAQIMVEALVELAHKLNLTACAEGVETQEALEFLNRIGCDAAQGYLISRPVPAHEVTAVIEHWKRKQEASPSTVDAVEAAPAKRA